MPSFQRAQNYLNPSIGRGVHEYSAVRSRGVRIKLEILDFTWSAIQTLLWEGLARARQRLQGGAETISHLLEMLV